MGKLNNKVAIVTGASRGIGKAIAELLANEGAAVVCTARTLREGDRALEGSLETTVAAIKAAGGEALAIACDISSEEQCEGLIAQARAHYGPCDVLVNNAVLTYFFPVKDYLPSRWIHSFAVNVHGPFMLSRLVLQDMIPRRHGAIVNVSSAGAIGPGRAPYSKPAMYGATCYGAAKAALERFTQGLAEEVYPDGISVTCVSPSILVATPGAVHHNWASGPDDRRAEPAEYMAKAVLILATEPVDRVSGWVTYSQVVLQKYGVIPRGRGIGFWGSGSGYSRT